MKRYEKGGLQETQAQNKIGVERRGQGVALVKSLDNAPAGLVQLGIIDGDAYKRAFTLGQGSFPNRVEELLGVPLGAAVHVV